MTSAELIQKFNLHYDNILSAAAPGLNEYEISLFLTQAHKEVVASYYNGIMGGDTVDSTEATKSLISRYILTDSAGLIPRNSAVLIKGLYQYYIPLKEDVLQLLAERMYPKEPLQQTNILVKPIQIDQIYRLIENPFRRPSDKRVWRVDEYVNEESILREVVLLSNFEATEYIYVYTYMKEPEPIILVNLKEDPWVSIGDLSIMGETSANVDGENGLDKKISPTLWELILNRAVELATRDYKENSLNAQVALNRRVE